MSGNTEPLSPETPNPADYLGGLNAVVEALPAISPINLAPAWEALGDIYLLLSEDKSIGYDSRLEAGIRASILHARALHGLTLQSYADLTARIQNGATGLGVAKTAAEAELANSQSNIERWQHELERFI